MWVIPLVETTAHINQSRADSVGKSAGQWVENLDDELLVGCSLMADGADESLVYVREGDDECLDASTHSKEAWLFAQKLHIMFVERKILNLPSYTQHMKDTLSQSFTIPLNTGCNILGPATGPSNETIDRAVAMVLIWFHLVIAIIKAEFPYYHLCQALSIFDVSESSLLKVVTSNDTISKLQRIANVI